MTWIWRARSPAALTVRASLLPSAAVVAAATAARAAAYRTGLLQRQSLPLPTIAVGNIAVGGAGKTPVAAWIAGFLARCGRRPGILLRGYGGDEATLHRDAVPNAVVVEHPDRVVGARIAAARGADVLVLDDAFQRLDVRRDLDLVLVSAETVDAVRWTLPAGPWRERWRALRRADMVIITRKVASDNAVSRALGRVQRSTRRPRAVARLNHGRLRRLNSSGAVAWRELAGRSVLAVAGIADPESFAMQLASRGASVRLSAWRDHYPYRRRDVLSLARAAETVDYVVTTAKDASKLGRLWPRSAREPLVADLEVEWSSGQPVLENALRSAIGEA